MSMFYYVSMSYYVILCDYVLLCGLILCYYMILCDYVLLCVLILSYYVMLCDYVLLCGLILCYYVVLSCITMWPYVSQKNDHINSKISTKTIYLLIFLFNDREGITSINVNPIILMSHQKFHFSR